MSLVKRMRITALDFFSPVPFYSNRNVIGSTTSQTKMTLKRRLLFGLVVAATVLCYASADDEEESTGLCEGYQQVVHTKPNRPATFAKRNPNYDITSVHNIIRDRNTVYWCDLEIPDVNDVMKHWKHYGFNATHWWVVKGCSGTFTVEECDTSNVIGGGPAVTLGKSAVQDAPAVPKPDKNWMHMMAAKQFDMRPLSRDGSTMV